MNQNPETTRGREMAKAETKFTPGPWQVDADLLGKGGPHDRIVIETCEPGGGTVVATANKMITAAMPNARLIAASPDLYDLAKNVGGLDGAFINGADPTTLRQALFEYRDQARAALSRVEQPQ